MERERGGEGRERRTAGELGMQLFTEAPASRGCHRVPHDEHIHHVTA